MIHAYHFLADNGTLRDGRPAPPDNQWLRHEGPISICNSGLHASERPLDTLTYAPGNLLCCVVLRTDIQEAPDKLVARERKILWRIDATALLRAFARHCALQVIDKWEPPPAVLEWLLTGNPSLQSAARSAVCSAACSAADLAARSAAYSAAHSAAYSAAYSAADSAADSAARSAADWTARSAACSAARSEKNDTLEEFIKEVRQGYNEWEFTL